MAKRGVLYLHWGTNRAPLERSIASLREHHPELPVHVEELPAGSTLLDKAKMFSVSPFDETLFLDSDTVVLGPLRYGFEMAVTWGLACCICENPWARRYPSCAKTLPPDAREFNTGVIFWKKSSQVQSLFTLWRLNNRSLDSSITFYGPNRELLRMPHNDQAGFAAAVAVTTSFQPCVLPVNWNFRPAWHRSWWGPIKIWHDYSEPPADLVAFTRQQMQPGAILEYRELVR